MQLRLSQLGFLKGKIDGKFGPVTLSAVKAFQRANDLEVSSVASAQMQQTLYAQGALDASGAPAEPGGGRMAIVPPERLLPT